MLGIEPDAINRRLIWHPWPGQSYGVSRYPLGPCTVSLSIAQSENEAAHIHINTDLAFTLEIDLGEGCHRELAIPAGFIEVKL